MNDEELYLKATNEVEGDSKDPALWAKAMALTGGDQDKAKYEYIKRRVEQLAKPKADVQKEYGISGGKATEQGLSASEPESGLSEGDGTRQDKESRNKNSDSSSTERGLTLKRFIVAFGLWLCCASFGIYSFWLDSFDRVLLEIPFYWLPSTAICAMIAVPFALLFKWIWPNKQESLVEIVSQFTIIILVCYKLSGPPEAPEIRNLLYCREVVLVVLPLAIGTFLMAAVSLRKRPVTWFLFAFFMPWLVPGVFIITLLEALRQSQIKK
jgi:hypothetical protein